MSGDTVKADDARVSRRGLLAAAGAATLGLLNGGASPPDSEPSRPTSTATSLPALKPLDQPPWWLTQHGPRSRVIEVASTDVLHGPKVDPILLRDTFDMGLRQLTDSPTAAVPRRAPLGECRQIVLKFNSVAADVVGTNEPLARVIVESLGDAGWPPEQIALVETPSYVSADLRTRRASAGWGPPIPVGGRLEPLAQYLYEADAIISVGLLKTHQLAGMSGVMKNLSHALMRRPALYHADGCSPFVGQVIGSPAVATRLKLSVLNAIRVVAQNGPDATREDVFGYGSVLLSFDPLALDWIGRSILAEVRHEHGLDSSIEVAYLDSAAVLGVGRWLPSEVDRQRLAATH